MSTEGNQAEWSPEKYARALSLRESGTLDDVQSEDLDGQIVEYERTAFQVSPLEWELEKTGVAAQRQQRMMADDAVQDEIAATELPTMQAYDVTPEEEADPYAESTIEAPTDPDGLPWLLSHDKSYSAYPPVFTPDDMGRFDSGGFPGVMRGVQDTLGTNTEVYFEPTESDFRKKAGPMFPDEDLSQLSTDSQQYKEWADSQWAEAYTEAQSDNRPIIRQELKPAYDRQQEGGRTLMDVMGSAHRGMTDSAQAFLGGAAETAALGLPNEMGAQLSSAMDASWMGGRGGASADDFSQDQQARQERQPWTTGAGMLGGAFVPGSATGALGRQAMRSIPGAAGGAMARLGQAAAVGGSTAYVEGGALATVKHMAAQARGVDREVDWNSELNPTVPGNARTRVGMGMLGGAALHGLGEVGGAIASRSRRQPAGGQTLNDLDLTPGIYDPGNPLVTVSPEVAAKGAVLGQQSASLGATLRRRIEEYTGRPATKMLARKGIRKNPEFEAAGMRSRAGNAAYADPVDQASREFGDKYGHLPAKNSESIARRVHARNEEYFESAAGKELRSSDDAIESVLAHVRKIAPEGEDLPGITDSPLWRNQIGSMVADAKPRWGGGDPVADGYRRVSWSEAQEMLPASRMKELERKVFQVEGVGHRSEAALTELRSNGFVDIKSRPMDARMLSTAITGVREMARGDGPIPSRGNAGHEALEAGLLKMRDQFKSDGKTFGGGIDDPITITHPATGDQRVVTGWSADNRRMYEAHAEGEEILRATGMSTKLELKRAKQIDLIVPLAEKLAKAAGKGTTPGVAMENAWRTLLKPDTVAWREFKRIGAMDGYFKFKNAAKAVHVTSAAGHAPNVRMNLGTDEDIGILDYAAAHMDPVFRAVYRRVGEHPRDAKRVTGDEVIEQWRQLPQTVRSLVREISIAGAKTVKDAASLRGGMTAGIAGGGLDDPTLSDIQVLVGLAETQKSLDGGGEKDEQ